MKKLLMDTVGWNKNTKAFIGMMSPYSGTLSPVKMVGDTKERMRTGKWGL